MKYILFAIAVLLLVQCGTRDENNEGVVKAINSGDGLASTEDSPQINMTILLDLSDRIKTGTKGRFSDQCKYDTALVSYLADFFWTESGIKGPLLAEGKFRILFLPKQKGVEEFSLDMKAINPDQKRILFNSFKADVSKYLTRLYDSASAAKMWPGADIWRFFKEDASIAVDQDPTYRNILFVLTDGYLLDTFRLRRQPINNQFEYLTARLITEQKLRNIDWKRRIDSTGFGLRSTRSDLSALEVYFLEINSEPGHLDDNDILSYVIKNWLTAMGVKTKDVFPSASPVITKERIKRALLSR